MLHFFLLQDYNWNLAEKMVQYCLMKHDLELYIKYGKNNWKNNVFFKNYWSNIGPPNSILPTGQILWQSSKNFYLV